MYSDYYYILEHHNKSIKGCHGLWFRRIYFTCDNNLTDKIKMCFRLQMSSPGDFISKNRLIPNVKDASLSYKKGKHNVMFGIIPFSSIAASNFLLVGISWEAGKKVWFIPNIKYVFYDEPQIGEIPSEDIYLNMTVYFKF